jgi:GR25 family glycosyltransferase involved in LPS biosynthesis
MQHFKTFIIRLSGNDHSCKMALDCKEQAAKFGIHAEYFEAINGLQADVHYELTGVPRPKKGLKKGKLGVIGCFFSHYYLWQACVQQNIPYLILEHDGYIIKDIPNTICNQFTDVLKLDRCDPFSNTYNDVIEQEKDIPLTIEKYVNHSPKAIHKIGTGNYFRGAYSYIIKPSGAQKLINFLKLNENGNGHRPADQQIGDGVLDTWVTVPTVAKLHPFYSIGTNLKTASLTGNPELL